MGIQNIPADSTVSMHGSLPKLSGNAAHVLSGQGQWVAGGGGGGTPEFIAGVTVANYSALPDPVANSGLLAVVLNNQGVWLINFYSKGLYYSDGAAWNYEGDYSITYMASQIVNTPAGNIAAVDVQGAINELDTEKVPTTRTVNAKALSADIILTPADIGSPSGNGTSSGANTGDQTISDQTISTSDITTNNASTAKHGFLKKLSNVAAEFMNGQGVWAVPAGGSGTPTQFNQSVAQQAGFAADTYLIGSAIAIPANSLKVGSRYRCKYNISKTSAGVAAPVHIVRFGTNGSTADAAILTVNHSAQTANADTGTFEIDITFRTVGATATIEAICQLRHGLQITGLGTLVCQTIPGTSGNFDSTVANSFIGISANGGASAAWTVQLVQAELENLQ